MKEGTACLLITTPGDDDNILNFLAQKRERDNPELTCFIVAVIEIVCEECKGTDRELICSHIYKQPFWKNKNKINSVSNLYTDPAMARRELLGKDDGEEGKAFPKVLVEKLAKSKFNIDFVIDRIYVGIDTDGGGEDFSETAIISVAKMNKGESGETKLVVLGLDSDGTTEIGLLNKMLVGHILELKKQRYYVRGMTKIIIMAERFALNTFYLVDLFKDLEDVEICYTKSSKKREIPGMSTTNDVKVCGVGTIRKYLRKGNLLFSTTFFTGRFPNFERVKANDNMKTKFVNQIKYFREKVEYGNNGRTTLKYSGKMNAKGRINAKGKMDDLVMALVIVVYWMEVVFSYGCTNIVLRKAKGDFEKNF